MVVVDEVDPLAERRMALAPKLVQQAGTRVRQRVLLQLDERRAGAVVGLRDLEAEAIGLVLDVTRERELDAASPTSREHADQQQQQRQRRDVSERREPEAARRSARSPRRPSGTPRRRMRQISERGERDRRATRGRARSAPSRGPSRTAARDRVIRFSDRVPQHDALRAERARSRRR